MHGLELTVTVSMGTTGDVGNIGELMQWTLPLPLSDSGMQQNVKEYEELLTNLLDTSRDIMGPVDDSMQQQQQQQQQQQMRSLEMMKSLVDQQLKNSVGSVGWLINMRRMLELQLRGAGAVAPDFAAIPDVPDAPDIPDVPDAPDAPDESDASDVSDESDSSDESDAPEVPADAPEVPADAPEVPADAPEVPADAPEVPATRMKYMCLNPKEDQEEEEPLQTRLRRMRKRKVSSSFFDEFAKEELALQFLEQQEHEHEQRGDCSGGGSMYDGNRASLIMKDVVQQITGSSKSSTFRLSNFEQAAQHREFCKEALEKRPLHGGAKSVYVVRSGYDEEFRTRMRSYVVGMLSRHAKTDQAAAEAKKALIAAAAAAAAAAPLPLPLPLPSHLRKAPSCRTCGKTGHYAKTCGRYS